MKAADNLGFEASPLGDNLGEWEVSQRTSTVGTTDLLGVMGGAVCCTLPCAEPFQVRLTSVPRNEQLWKDLQTLSLVSPRPRLPDGSQRQTENIQQTTDNGATGHFARATPAPPRPHAQGTRRVLRVLSRL
jgi:hypothetical protein